MPSAPACSTCRAYSIQPSADVPLRLAMTGISTRALARRHLKEGLVSVSLIWIGSPERMARMVTELGWLGSMAVFSVSALILNYLLYRSRVVPTWISIWGFIGGVLLLASAIIEMFGTALGGWQAIFTAPIGVNEMVLAVWLIIKGFDMRHLEQTSFERELVGV